MEQVANKVFELINNKFKNPEIKILDSNEKTTTDIDDGRIFSFEFIVGNNNYGNAVILLSSDNSLNMYYGDNIGKILDSDARDKKDSFVTHLKMIAQRNRLEFELKDISRLKYDLSGLKKDVTESFKKIFEGYYGTSKTSYNPQGQAKIIIKHSKPIGEEDARFRNISSLFIENADGERFKLPFKKLAGARAMARHVTEGGNPYDLFGQHISEMVKDINTLGGFLRSSKAYEHLEETAGLVETGRAHYESMRKSLNQIAGKRGYHNYKESWEPSEITEADRDVDSIRGMFMEKSVNARIEEALPLLARLQELAEQQVEEGDVIKHKFAQKQAQKGKDKYKHNADIANDIPMWDPIKKRNIPGGVDYPSHYVDRSTLEPYDHFEVEPTGTKNGGAIIGITQKGERVRISSTTNIDIARALADAYGRGGFTDKDIQKVPLSDIFKDDIPEVKAFEEWADGVLEGTWAIPEDYKANLALRKFFEKEQPLGIDAINVTDALSNILGDDELFDRLEMKAEKNPDADARPIVFRFIRDLYRNLNKYEKEDQTVISKMFASVKKAYNPTKATEDCGCELDADKKQDLKASVNRDLDKYTHEKKLKEFEMKDLTEYMDEVEGVAQAAVKEPEQVMESVETKDEEIDMKQLIERTNYLLKK